MVTPSVTTTQLRIVKLVFRFVENKSPLCWYSHRHGGRASRHISFVTFCLHDQTLTAKPAPKQCTDQTQEEVEVWYNLSQQPAKDPRTRTDDIPTAHTLEALLVHNIGTTPDSDVDVLASHRAVDDTSDNDSGQRNAKGDLSDERTGRSERRTGDKWSSVVVNDD